MSPKASNASPGRPREFDIDEATTKLMELFWENGYEATGLSDIIKATGLAKASLYAAYGNKQKMYLKALAHYETLTVDSAVAILRNPAKKPFERIDAFLSLPIDAVNNKNDRRGCFLCNASADRAWADNDIAQSVRNSYEKLHRAITQSLTDAGIKEVSSTAQLTLTTYTGLRVRARSGTKVSAMTEAKEACMVAVGDGE